MAVFHRSATTEGKWKLLQRVGPGLITHDDDKSKTLWYLKPNSPMNPAKHVVVGLGEVLWDIFPDGPRFGGAPANYACHAASLGADSHVVGAVGRDDLGTQALQSLRNHGVETSAVQQSEYPTGTVHIQLDAEGKASYEFLANTAWDNLKWSPELEALAVRTKAVCFGTLGQRSRESQQTIRRFVTTTPVSCLRIFDINLRPPFYRDETILESLEIANIVKMNDDELPIVANICGFAGTPRHVMRLLVQRFDLQLIALTRGASGALLVRDKQASDHPGVPTSVMDTVGAGDSFTAAMTLGLLAGHGLDAINDWAARVAAFVCSQAGATPSLPSELRHTAPPSTT